MGPTNVSEQFPRRLKKVLYQEPQTINSLPRSGYRAEKLQSKLTSYKVRKTTVSGQGAHSSSAGVLCVSPWHPVRSVREREREWKLKKKKKKSARLEPSKTNRIGRTGAAIARPSHHGVTELHRRRKKRNPGSAKKKYYYYYYYYVLLVNQAPVCGKKFQVSFFFLFGCPIWIPSNSPGLVAMDPGWAPSTLFFFFFSLLSFFFPPSCSMSGEVVRLTGRNAHTLAITIPSHTLPKKKNPLPLYCTTYSVPLPWKTCMNFQFTRSTPHYSIVEYGVRHGPKMKSERGH